MEEKNLDLSVEETGPVQDSGETPSLQTDSESTHEKEAGFPTINSEGSFSQTESERRISGDFSSEDGVENTEKEPVSQTGKKQSKRVRRPKEDTANESHSDSETNEKQETGTQTRRRKSSSGIQSGPCH